MLAHKQLTLWRTIRVIRLSSMCLLGLLLLSSCSVDEWRNVQRTNHDDCTRIDGGTYIANKYCVIRSKTASQDAAVSDATTSGDAAAQDAGGDASVYANCSEEGKSEQCYDGEDPATALQAPCHPGTHTCHDGHWSDCIDQQTPSAEECNGEDDDCDGNLDEGLNKNLGTTSCQVMGAKGVCQEGTQICLMSKPTCAQINYPATDMCNGQDDDCDGETDEETNVDCYGGDSGCAQSANGEYICRGMCKPGVFVCHDGLYDENNCENDVTPAAAEACTSSGEDMLDENCNGEVDEGCSCNAGTTCYTGTPGSTQMHAPCHAGTQTCSDPTHGSCMGEVIPEEETCANEGVDNDCDGTLDNVPMIGTSCADKSKGIGACKTGAKWRCQDGAQVCVDATPTAERCDGAKIDEDCDGKIDENVDTTNDNCGTCGNACGAGFACCSKVCVNIKTSNANCNGCGVMCPGSTPTCCGGSCVNTKSNNANCGACGKACGGLAACSNGGCALLGL